MPTQPVHSNPQEQLCKLRTQLAALERSPRAVSRRISSGCAALDRILPAHGFRAGTLVQWIAAPGSGAAALALIAAREACRAEARLVVVDAASTFFPPAAWALGLQDMIVVRPQGRRDQLWAMDQALRCEAIAAAWTTIDSVPSRAFRRWQLAAEQSGSLGLLVQSERALQEPTWADVQLLVQARPLWHCDPAESSHREKDFHATGGLAPPERCLETRLASQQTSPSPAACLAAEQPGRQPGRKLDGMGGSLLVHKTAIQRDKLAGGEDQKPGSPFDYSLIAALRVSTPLNPSPPSERRWKVTVARGRGREGQSVELMMDDETGTLNLTRTFHETHPLHLVSQLAGSETAPRPTGT